MFPRVALMATMLAALLQSGALTVAASPAISQAAAAHVLNRLAYGPRPGDLERLERIGIQGWIAQQLHPERIDDRVLEARLAGFQTLGLDAATILREYHTPAIRERRERRRQSAVGTDPAVIGTDTEVAEGAAAPAITPARVPRAMTEAQRRDRLVLAELAEARLLRAVASERQLQEVLTDFWFNHFNVFAGKGPTRAYLTAFERDAIRPFVLGSFRQMLEAVASRCVTV